MQTATFDLNFAARHGLATGATFTARQQWQKAFLYDYVREDPIATLTTTGKQYVNFAALSPSGSEAVFEVREMEDRRTVALKIFDFATKKFADVKLPPPATGG